MSRKAMNVEFIIHVTFHWFRKFVMEESWWSFVKKCCVAKWKFAECIGYSLNISPAMWKLSLHLGMNDWINEWQNELYNG